MRMQLERLGMPKKLYTFNFQLKQDAWTWTPDRWVKDLAKAKTMAIEKELDAIEVELGSSDYTEAKAVIEKVK